jgi:hypothetical protein
MRQKQQVPNDLHLIFYKPFTKVIHSFFNNPMIQQRCFSSHNKKKVYGKRNQIEGERSLKKFKEKQKE